MTWVLSVNRDAMQELRAAGPAVVAVLQELRNEQTPWASDLQIPRLDKYERFAAGHWIGYEVDHERGMIRILYIR